VTARTDRWLKLPSAKGASADSGQLFDTLDQAMNAALQGFGVSLGDLVLLEDELASGALQTPLPSILITGKGYAVTLPAQGQIVESASTLADWLTRQAQEKYLQR